MPNEKHAVYATARRGADIVTFRVGQPVAWNVAMDRWYRLDDRRVSGRRPVVKANRRKYEVETFEVRAVDAHGRGLGSKRHETALTARYRDCRVSR